MIDKLIKWTKNYYGFLIVLFLDVVIVLVPFLISNSLNGFDSPGHLLAAYYVKNSFWPWPDGWNMMTLSGYPQGLLYPSLFHWLVAALGFIFPLELSMKILIVLAILATPILVFILAKKIFKNNLAASFTTVLFGIFYFFETGLNDNMFCDLLYGMMSHLFSLVLFFAYLLFLFLLTKNSKSWRFPGLFLALCLLTHIATGVAAFGLAIIVFLLSKKGTELKINLLKHIALGLLLSAWWWLPFIVNLNYVTGSNASSMTASILIFLSPLILFMNYFVFKIKSENSLFFKSLAIFSGFIIVTCFLSNFLKVESLPIHFYRFFAYAIFVTPFLFAYLITLRGNKNFPVIHLVAVFCFLFYIFFFRIVPVGPFQSDLLNNLGNYYQNGRVIANGFSRKLDSRFHSVRMDLPLKNNIPIFEGLFVESSANGWYIMSLLNTYGSYSNNGNTFVWAYTNLKNTDNLAWASKIFGINYEYHFSDNSPKKEESNLLEKIAKADEKPDLYISEKDKIRQESELLFHKQKIRLADDSESVDMLGGDRSGFYYQSFYKVNDTGLAEALSVRPVDIDSDWNNNVKKWWTTDWLKASSTDPYFYDKPMLIDQRDVSAWQLAEKNINLTLTVLNKRMDSFMVDASTLPHPAPIYIKVGYFPYWKAYDSRGAELKIYKTSPNFMLVYSDGKIIFKYEKPWYYYGAYIFSGFGVLLLIISFFFPKRKI